MSIFSYLCTVFHALIISFPLFVCTILSAELVVSLCRQYDRARACLLLWSLTATVLYAMHYLFFSHFVAWLPVTDAVYTACNLAVYPLYLIYIYELTDERPLRHRLMWTRGLMGISVLFGILVGVLYQLMSPEETRDFIDVYLYGTTQGQLTGLALVQEAVHDLCRVLFAIGVLVTVVVGVLRIRRYNTLMDALYADSDERKLEIIDLILKLVMVISVLSMIVNGLGRRYFADSEWLSLPAVAFSCLLFAIGQAGLYQRYTIRDVEKDEADEESLSPSDEEAIREHPLTQRLRTLVEDEQLFLQPDLKLDDLARKLGTNRTYLLRAIKVDLGMSFSEYINRQRIRYANNLMAQHPNWNKADIAGRVGYSSLSTFYRNLREFSETE